MADLKTEPDVHASPSEDEIVLTRVADWTEDEETRAKRK